MLNAGINSFNIPSVAEVLPKAQQHQLRAYIRALRLSLLILLFLPLSIHAQTLGGRSVFNFLRLPNTPQLSALGGVNITEPSNDIGLAFNNPAQLRPAMHSQMNAVFNDFYGGIGVYHLSLGYHHEKLNTSFAGGLQFFNYGKTAETDAAGNMLGDFRPTDWVIQLSASRSYEEKWNYGATLKFISSNYGQYHSNGIAVDFGILYSDSTNGIFASGLAKNIGTQLKKYEGTDPDDLPFELQLGITKKLEHAPLALSLTVQRVNKFNILYSDTSFNDINGYPNPPASKFSFGKIIDHFILGATFYIGDRVTFQAGYNFLRRKELNIGEGGNGLNGFSMGAGVHLGKLDVRFARSYYQSASAYNQFGINLQLNRYFGKW